VFKLSASFEFVVCLLTSTIPAELKQPILPSRILHKNTTMPSIFNNLLHGLGSKHPVKSKYLRKIDSPPPKILGCYSFPCTNYYVVGNCFFFPLNTLNIMRYGSKTLLEWFLCSYQLNDPSDVLLFVRPFHKFAKSLSMNQLKVMDDCKWQIVKYNIYDLDSMKVLVEFHY
jgi:hypothetical protein